MKSLNMVIVAFLVFVSCDSFIDVPPPKTQLIKETVFWDDATASAAMAAVYYQVLSSNGIFGGGQNSVAVLAGLSSDELLSYSSVDYRAFYANNIIPANPVISGIWGDAYSVIYKVNAIIEGVNASNGLSILTQSQLLGEAKFIRALTYFYLYNLFGAIPYTTTTRYQDNNNIDRTSEADIISYIIEDLKSARDVLTDENYSTWNFERVRVNRMVVTALLARVYLYNRNWDLANQSATELIGRTDLFYLVDIDSVFLKNSPEAILQFKPVNPYQNTQEGNVLIFTSNPSFVSIADELYESFESDDLRKAKWISVVQNENGIWYCPYKYKIKTGGDPLNEYSMLLRLAELYLIRSEARVMMGDIDGGRSDLNIIRRRAGLDSVTYDNATLLVNAISHERRLELFVEYGHRWLDLKRMNYADSILAPIKPGWNSTDKLYPIPKSEILINKNIQQNPGYDKL